MTLSPAATAQGGGRFGARSRAVALVAPLVLFLMVVFVLPLGAMLFHAVDNPEVRRALPETSAVLRAWPGGGLPPDAAFTSLARDLRQADGNAAVAEAGRRLNYETAGYRTLLLKTARQVRAMPEAADWRATLTGIDPRWGEAPSWAAMRRASQAFTPYYLLAAIDLRVDDDGDIVRAPVEERLYLDTLARTMWIGIVVTGLCFLIGYPLAYALTVLPRRFADLLMLSILLPFWTSLLVRTSAWIVVLQKEGIVNSTLIGLGLTDGPLALVFNRFGLYVAMVHILLPFMILPIFSVMKGIPPSYMRASASLGAPPWRGFLQVYFPLTLPGVGAGALLTFIISAGYYITPTLVGGAQDQMLSYFIAFYANTTINWGMSAALGAVLLACVILLYATVGRLIGVARIAGIE